MNPLYSLSGISAFVVTVQMGSFTEAAVRLGMTKSAVGKSVTKLEERLGVNLLIRTTRRLTLTAEGEKYFQECCEALNLLEQAGNQIQDNQSVMMGKLRIDLPAAFGRKCIVPLLLDLMDEHPQLMLSVSFNERYIDIIEENIDLVVRIGNLPDSIHLVARQLTTQKQVLCATPEYIQRYGEPLSVDKLSEHRCIIGIRQKFSFSWMLIDNGVMRQYTPPAFYELADGDAMLEAVLRGHGIAQLPLWMISKQLESGQLQRVLISSEGYESPINLIWPKKQNLPPRTRYLIDILVQAALEGKFN
ncbi:MAG: LysR family transcriptional regulator [Providencia sp.]|uniref:LysR family transcriptional regulator n=1 Tax=Providencia sp. TaxID=589 RepID=UPI003F9CD59E